MKRLVLATAALIVISAPVFAQPQDTAFDKNNSVILDNRGGCVRTKWTADQTACDKAAPKPKPVVRAPAPEPQKIVELSVEQRTVYFDFNKAALSTAAKAKLDDVASFIRDNKITKISVVGYTDKIGTAGYNDALSKKRAKTVQNYISNKVKVISNTQVRGLGVSRTAECDDEANRTAKIACLANDRRVEVELTYEK